MDAFKSTAVPWFQTIYLQRAMPVKFREELFFSVSPNTNFSQENLSIGSTIEILRNGSEQTMWLFEKMQTMNYRTILEKVLFSRLLSSLGFYKEALEILPIMDIHAEWSFEEEYASCTKLFLQNIFSALKNDFPYEELKFVFNKLSGSPESLRMRLSLTILGSVFNGQRRNIPELKL